MKPATRRPKSARNTEGLAFLSTFWHNARPEFRLVPVPGASHKRIIDNKLCIIN